jgi:hypothetical protein
MPYFVRIKSRVFGPFDESQLLDMKAKGKITRSTEVSENKNDWLPAESLQFLFAPVYAAQSASQPSAVNEPADWFYSVNGTDGYGPVTATAIEHMLRSGQLSGNSYVWQQGQNARFVKNEPQFSSPSGGGLGSPSRMENTGGGMANIGGEITGASEQVDTGRMLRPIAASLGWIMFLKIVFLLVVIVLQGFYLMWIGSFSVFHAVRRDDAADLLVTLVVLVVSVTIYVLLFKTFLCFWKYHSDLYQTVATGRASDLIQGNQSQFLFWKWLGITVIANLTVFVVSITVVMIAAGLESDIAIRIRSGIFNPFGF